MTLQSDANAAALSNARTGVASVAYDEATYRATIHIHSKINIEVDQARARWATAEPRLRDLRSRLAELSAGLNQIKADATFCEFATPTKGDSPVTALNAIIAAIDAQLPTLASVSMLTFKGYRDA